MALALYSPSSTRMSETSLPASEQSAVAYVFGMDHGLMPIEGTYQELVDQGYIDGENLLWEDGCLFSPELVSSAVAAYMKRYAMQDVVIMGQQSSDGSNMKTPYLLAEKMGWPCVRDVVKMEPVDESSLKVTGSTGNGLLVQVVKTPCVLVVGNAQDSYLRVPTLKDKMRLGKQPVELVSLEELGLGEPALEELESRVLPVSLEAVSARRDTVWIDGDSPREKAQKLYETYLQGRLANEISSGH